MALGRGQPFLPQDPALVLPGPMASVASSVLGLRGGTQICLSREVRGERALKGEGEWQTLGRS